MVQLTSMVDYEVDDGVAVLTLDNPPVNAPSQGVRQGPDGCVLAMWGTWP